MLTFSPRGAKYHKVRDGSERIKKMGGKGEEKKIKQKKPNNNSWRVWNQNCMDPKVTVASVSKSFSFRGSFHGREEPPPAVESAGSGTLAESMEEIMCQPPHGFPVGGHSFPWMCCRSEISPLAVVGACAGLSRNPSKLHRYIGHELKEVYSWIAVRGLLFSPAAWCPGPLLGRAGGLLAVGPTLHQMDRATCVCVTVSVSKPNSHFLKAVLVEECHCVIAWSGNRIMLLRESIGHGQPSCRHCCWEFFPAVDSRREEGTFPRKSSCPSQASVSLGNLDRQHCTAGVAPELPSCMISFPLPSNNYWCPRLLIPFPNMS